MSVCDTREYIILYVSFLYLCIFSCIMMHMKFCSSVITKTYVACNFTAHYKFQLAPNYACH